MERKLNLAEEGLAMAYTEYERIMLTHLWGGIPDEPLPEANSSKLWGVANRELAKKHNGAKSISRASVINAANRLVDEGTWDFRDATGKGGYQRVYRAKMSKPELREKIRALVLEKMDPERFG